LHTFGRKVATYLTPWKGDSIAAVAREKKGIKKPEKGEKNQGKIE
jgi:hypothetical protein